MINFFSIIYDYDLEIKLWFGVHVHCPVFMIKKKNSNMWGGEDQLALSTCNVGYVICDARHHRIVKELVWIQVLLDSLLFQGY